MLTFPNGSDHAMITCYFELYEEDEIENVNDVWPNSKHLQLVGLYACNAHHIQHALA